MLGKNINISKFTWIRMLVTTGIVFGNSRNTSLYVSIALKADNRGKAGFTVCKRLEK
jgi:hypothetical protein